MSKKNNYSYIGIAFVILIFGIYFVPKIVDRISNDDVSRNESRSDQKNENYVADLEFIKNAEGEAKKVPDFSFTDQNGNIITNKDFEGKVYVIDFFFTSCPTICPRMTSNLVDIQNTFKDKDDFGIASFSINPENDSPEVLKAYADKYGVNNPDWHLMTGEKDAIYNLANKGFFIFTAENSEVEGGFEHSGNFALIDKNGFIRSRAVGGNPLIYYNGIISETEKVDDDGQAEQISMLKADITKLLKEN
ncbi:SCO family protein [Lacinutrix undariae]